MRWLKKEYSKFGRLGILGARVSFSTLLSEFGIVFRRIHVEHYNCVTDRPNGWFLDLMSVPKLSVHDQRRLVLFGERVACKPKMSFHGGTEICLVW